MITVTCPNCRVENSALSRRCISCSSELIIDGHVRCDNCRALTPQKLEFCELCGSYLFTVNNLGDHEEDHSNERDSLRPPLTSATPSLTDSPGDESQRKDARDQVTKDNRESDPGQIRDVSTKSEDSLVPGWLLDVDAALKTSGTADVPDNSTETSVDSVGVGTGVVGADSAGTSQAAQSRTPESPQSSVEGSESLEWINALEGDLGGTSAETGEPDEGETPSDRDRLSSSGKKTKPATAPLVGLVVSETLRQSTQPLDAKGNLLGVPQQLAGTDLPSWLSDQLQRADEPRDDPAIDDIELPEPTRATILSPGEPEDEEESSPFDASVLDPSFEKWLQEFTEEPISPDWMDDDDVQIDQPSTGEVVLPGAETPEWLHDIHEEEGETAELLGITEAAEATGKLAGITGAIQIEPAIAPSVVDLPFPDYSISKEQLVKIALLEGIIHAEPLKKKRMAVEPPPSSPLLLRVLLAGALILVIVLAAVIPSSTEWIDSFASTGLSDPAQDLYDQLEDASGAPVLVAFDYTPAMAGELNPISLTLLEQLAENGSIALTVSQSAAGSEVASIVTEEVENLEWMPIGYLPGEAIGLRSLAECIAGAENCETLFGKALPPEIQESLAETAAVLILTSDSDSLIDWIEQVGAPNEDFVLLAGVTQTLGPVVNPYYVSDQLMGVLIGLPDLAAYEQVLLGIESDDSINISSGALVIWMTAAFLLAGLIYYAITGLRNSRSE